MSGSPRRVIISSYIFLYVEAALPSNLTKSIAARAWPQGKTEKFSQLIRVELLGLTGTIEISGGVRNRNKSDFFILIIPHTPGVNRRPRKF